MGAPERQLAALGVTVLGAAALLGAAACSPERPEGPQPVAYDRQTCERCRMLVSDPSFAAQLHTEDGRVLFFDDPGCLLLYEAEHDVEMEAAWFHHVREDRWLPRGEVAFARVGESPMGYGLGAVERGGEEGALSHAEALAHARAREAERRPEAPAP